MSSMRNPHFFSDTAVQTFEAAEEAAQALEAARPEVLGFDIEWQVSFVSGQVHHELERYHQHRF